MTAALSFDLLDRHVIFDKADEVALIDSAGSLTFADLLHEVASVAGGLVQLGLREGADMAIEVGGHEATIGLLAAIRMGVSVAPTAAFALTGTAPHVRIPEAEPVDWHTVVTIGRIDPLPAARTDPPGYRDAMLSQYEELAVLLDGRTLER